MYSRCICFSLLPPPSLPTTRTFYTFWAQQETALQADLPSGHQSRPKTLEGGPQWSEVVVHTSILSFGYGEKLAAVWVARANAHTDHASHGQQSYTTGSHAPTTLVWNCVPKGGLLVVLSLAMPIFFLKCEFRRGRWEATVEKKTPRIHPWTVRNGLIRYISRARGGGGEWGIEPYFYKTEPRETLTYTKYDIPSSGGRAGSKFLNVPWSAGSTSCPAFRNVDGRIRSSMAVTYYNTMFSTITHPQNARKPDTININICRHNKQYTKYLIFNLALYWTTRHHFQKLTL